MAVPPHSFHALAFYLAFPKLFVIMTARTSLRIDRKPFTITSKIGTSDPI
jgi:hypothetical protein